MCVAWPEAIVCVDHDWRNHNRAGYLLRSTKLYPVVDSIANFRISDPGNTRGVCRLFSRVVSDALAGDGSGFLFQRRTDSRGDNAIFLGLVESTTGNGFEKDQPLPE
jgi:hypothetical protein